jgi:hypothetical protein
MITFLEICLKNVGQDSVSGIVLSQTSKYSNIPQNILKTNALLK